jgi:hypothetical protein
MAFCFNEVWSERNRMLKCLNGVYWPYYWR